MEKIVFVKPTLELKNQVVSYAGEHFQMNEYEIDGSAMLFKMDYEEWIKYINENSDKFEVFLVVRKSDERIIGIVDIRYKLYNDFYKNYGGNITYSIRPTERGRGYSAMILKKALEYFKDLNVSKIMLSCYKDNEFAIRTIVNCNGKLEREVEYNDNILQIYYISVK